MKNKYFIDRDESGDWYLIEANKRQEWKDWDWRQKEAPDFATGINWPNSVEFEFDLKDLI